MLILKAKANLEEDIESSMEETPLDSWVSNRLCVRRCLQFDIFFEILEKPTKVQMTSQKNCRLCFRLFMVYALKGALYFNYEGDPN